MITMKQARRQAPANPPEAVYRKVEVETQAGTRTERVLAQCRTDLSPKLSRIVQGPR